jgi:hypothetical protein
MKFYIKCKTEKPLKDFKELTLRYTKVNGEVSIYNYVDPRCNACRSEYMRVYHKKNPKPGQRKTLTAY